MNEAILQIIARVLTSAKDPMIRSATYNDGELIVADDDGDSYRIKADAVEVWPAGT